MTNRSRGTVEAISVEREGLQELLVRPESGEGGLRPAINLTSLNGPVIPGDNVEINTTAVDLKLGTGGFDYVITVLNRPPISTTPPGHIIKLRYTPLQTPVLAVEAQESPHHEEISEFGSLEEMPVVCTELHSQLPAVCTALQWGLRECGASARVVYIMTDGASLPLAISRMVPALKERGLLVGVITAGHAFGGDTEAVNIYSALAAAKVVHKADVVVIGQGPGNVGTATPLGFSGVDQGLAVNAVASLGGTPIFVPRISFSDERSRHVGLSHHSITNLNTIVRAHTLLPIPRLARYQQNRLNTVLAETGIAEKHDVITVDADKGLKALEACGIAVSTMGRGLTQERAFFLAAAAAGLLAAQLLEARQQRADTDTETNG